MDVKDKVVVVTGGVSGIGLALCKRFAQEGAHVVLSDLSQEACERKAADIGAFPSCTVTKHAAVGFTEWLAATYGDQGIGVSLLVPAAVKTLILAGKQDTPQGQDAMTTDELADVVMEGLAEERFLINTHPWVLDRFAVKARDYEEYIHMLRTDRAKTAAKSTAPHSH